MARIRLMSVRFMGPRGKRQCVVVQQTSSGGGERQPGAKSIRSVSLTTCRNTDAGMEGRIVKDGVRKAIQDRQIALTNLVHAIQEYRKLAEATPLTLQGSPYAHAVLELNKAIDRAEALLP